MSTTFGALAVILVLILINAFMNAAEIAMISVRRARVKQLADEGVPAAIRLRAMLANPRTFIATIEIGVTMAGFFASAFGADNLAPIAMRALEAPPLSMPSSTADTVAFIGVTIGVAMVTLILGELVPKTLGIERAESIALRVTGVVTFLSRITWPLVVFLTSTTNLIVRLLGGRRSAHLPSITEEEIISMIETGEHEGVVTSSEEEMIRNIFDFTDRRVSDVMVPRPDMFELPEEMTIAEAGPAIRAAGYSRIPLYQDDRERITGMVRAKDVLGAYVNGSTARPLQALAHPVLFVPETKRVGELLRELQRSRQSLAVAVDEFGGVSGMLTIEDLLEEIVGEIQDESEHEIPPLQRLSPTELLVAGNLLVDDVLEALDIRIREDERVESTVAGLILEAQGRIPEPGDEVRWHDILFTVEEMNRHRIQRVRVVLEQEPPGGADEDDVVVMAPGD